MWIYCDSKSAERNAEGSGATSASDGGLVDMPGSWHNATVDENGTPLASVNYTLLGYHSYCNSVTGDPDDITPANCQCYMPDLGASKTLEMNTNYPKHCKAGLAIPEAWGDGTFTCVWFYEIYKPGYFNRYPFVFEVNVTPKPSSASKTTAFAVTVAAALLITGLNALFA